MFGSTGFGDNWFSGITDILAIPTLKFCTKKAQSNGYSGVTDKIPIPNRSVTSENLCISWLLTVDDEDRHSVWSGIFRGAGVPSCVVLIDLWDQEPAGPPPALGHDGDAAPGQQGVDPDAVLEPDDLGGGLGGVFGTTSQVYIRTHLNKHFPVAQNAGVRFWKQEAIMLNDTAAMYKYIQWYNRLRL